MTKVNLFTGGIQNKHPNKELTPEEVVNLIKSDKYKEQIQKIRSLSKTEALPIKKNLDYITPGGIFTERSKTNLKESSGFAHLDIDDVKEENLEKVKNSIISSKYTHICHLSPSGNGFKVWVKIPKVKDDDAYKGFWEAIREEYNLPNKIDTQAKDISRACFMSYDPNIYYNPDSEVFTQTKQINTLDVDTMNFINLDSDIIPIIAKNWIEGQRQELAVSTSGVLRKLGYGINTVKSVINKICEITNDNETLSRLKAVITTFKKDESDIKGISGWKEFLEEKDYLQLLEIINQEDKNIVLINPDEDDTEGVNEMLSKEINMDYIVEDLIYPEALTMIYSPPANYKSMLSYYLSLCIGSGKEFLGRKTKKSNVLYLDLENDNKTRKMRLPGMIKALNITDEPSIRFKYFINIMDGKQKINKNAVKLLENLIIKYNSKVLIIDTLHRAAEYKENNADDINRIYNEVFKYLIEKFKISIIFLHHANKTGSYRGSSDFMGISHVALQVEKNGDKPEFTVHNRKDRNNEIKGFKVKIISDDEKIELKEIFELSKINSSTETEYAIEEFLKYEPKSREDILTFIDNKFDGTVSQSTVKKVLSKMKRDIKIKSTMEGRKSIYSLVTEEELNIDTF